MNVVIFFGQAPRPLALPPQLPFRDLFPGCVRGDAYLAVYLAVRPPMSPRGLIPEWVKVEPG
nr:hypothetical protein [Acidobacteriota bacterium]